MKDYISDFSNHIKQSLKIGKKSRFKRLNQEFQNILICGLGGSGIGGTIVSEIVQNKSKVPITISKNYQVPNFANNKTLYNFLHHFSLANDLLHP